MAGNRAQLKQPAGCQGREDGSRGMSRIEQMSYTVWIKSAAVLTSMSVGLFIEHKHGILDLKTENDRMNNA